MLRARSCTRGRRHPWGDPSGGSGKAAGIFIAIVTLQFLSSGFNLLHVSSFLKDLAWGVLLVFVMVLNVVSARRKAKKE